MGEAGSWSSILVPFHLVKVLKSPAVPVGKWRGSITCFAAHCEVCLWSPVATDAELSPKLEKITAAHVPPETPTGPLLTHPKCTPRWVSIDSQGTGPEKHCQEGTMQRHPCRIWDNPLQSSYHSYSVTSFFLLKFPSLSARNWEGSCRMNGTARSSSNCTNPPCQPPQTSSSAEVYSKSTTFHFLRIWDQIFPWFTYKSKAINLQKAIPLSAGARKSKIRSYGPNQSFFFFFFLHQWRLERIFHLKFKQQFSIPLLLLFNQVLTSMP